MALTPLALEAFGPRILRRSISPKHCISYLYHPIGFPQRYTSPITEKLLALFTNAYQNTVCIDSRHQALHSRHLPLLDAVLLMALCRESGAALQCNASSVDASFQRSSQAARVSQRQILDASQTGIWSLKLS